MDTTTTTNALSDLLGNLTGSAGALGIVGALLTIGILVFVFRRFFGN